MGDKRPGDALAARIRMRGKACIGDMGCRAGPVAADMADAQHPAIELGSKSGEGRGEPVRQRLVTGNVGRDAIGLARAVDGFKDRPDRRMIRRRGGTDQDIARPAAGQFSSSAERMTRPSRP